MWVVNSGGFWIRERKAMSNILFMKERWRLSLFPTFHHNLFHCCSTTECCCLQTTDRSCRTSRKGMKCDYSLAREAKTTTSLNSNRGKRAEGHLFHGLTFPQYWSCSTNKISVWGWGRGAAEKLGLSLKEKANGNAGRGEFPVASWAMQQQSAGHLYRVTKHNSNTVISSPPHQEHQRQELSKS